MYLSLYVYICLSVDAALVVSGKATAGERLGDRWVAAWATAVKTSGWAADGWRSGDAPRFRLVHWTRLVSNGAFAVAVVLAAAVRART